MDSFSFPLFFPFFSLSLIYGSFISLWDAAVKLEHMQINLGIIFNYSNMKSSGIFILISDSNVATFLS